MLIFKKIAVLFFKMYMSPPPCSINITLIDWFTLLGFKKEKKEENGVRILKNKTIKKKKKIKSNQNEIK